MLIRSIWPWLILGLLAVGGGIFFGAAHMEENDAFCASCHTQPESTYFNRSQAPQAVDVASFHHGQSVRCIDCHSGSGLVGRMGGMLVGAGDLLAFVTRTAQQPAPLTVPIRDENCLKCHADTPRTRQFNRHFHAFLGKWQALDSNAAHCVDCHTGHATDGDPTLEFLKEDQVKQVCMRCHQFAGQGG